MRTQIDPNYAEWLRNIKLFLHGKNLDPAGLEIYKILIKKTLFARNGVPIDLPVKVLAMQLAWPDDKVITKLIELKRKNLFHKMELAGGNLTIQVKDLREYARLTH